MSGLDHLACFILDLLDRVLEVDTARALVARESVMRHYLAPPFPISALALGVTEAPAPAPLITRPRSPQAIVARLPSALPPAIALAVVALLAHPHLLSAPLANEHSIELDASLHARQPNQKAGQRRSIASLSSRDVRTYAISTPFQKARE